MLAAAGDAVLLARRLIGYWQAAGQMEPDLPGNLLGAVPTTLHQPGAPIR